MGIPGPSPEWTQFLREFGLPTFLLLVIMYFVYVASKEVWRFYQPLKKKKFETEIEALSTMAQSSKISADTGVRIEQAMTLNFGKMFEKQEALHRDFRGIRCAEEEESRKSGRFKPVKLDDTAGS